MKHLITLVTLLSAAVLAQDPNNCKTEGKARKGSDFVLTEKSDNAYVESLSKIFEDQGRLVYISDVFEDGNRDLQQDALGLKWNDGDDDTEKWLPQGISGTADAHLSGTYEGKDGWVVSWYMDDPTKSVRVSFVDPKEMTYRHVLLVYPHEKDDFREIPIHAGGIVWYETTLWVVDTDKGIRVFDLTNIWRVDTGDHVGKNADGTYTAQGYKYVMPQIMWYEWTPDFKFRFSFMSLDRTVQPHSILIGEFQYDSEAVPVRMMQFDVDESRHRLEVDGDKLAKGTWAYCVNIDEMQGAVQADGTIYISSSNKGTALGDIFTWTPGDKAALTGHTPAGNEDMMYDERTKEVFTVTERKGGRYIIRRKVADLQP